MSICRAERDMPRQMESTAGSRKLSRSEFQTVGPATEKEIGCGEHVEQTIDGVWQADRRCCPPGTLHTGN